jgi:hypothetical protein
MNDPVVILLLIFASCFAVAGLFLLALDLWERGR